MDSITIPPTMPATVYVRWSSEAQTGRDSLRRQLEAAERYAGEHRLHIVETIIDEAVSAFSGDHLTKGRLGEFIGRVRDPARGSRRTGREGHAGASIASACTRSDH